MASSRILRGSAFSGGFQSAISANCIALSATRIRTEQPGPDLMFATVTRPSKREKRNLNPKTGLGLGWVSETSDFKGLQDRSACSSGTWREDETASKVSELSCTSGD